MTNKKELKEEQLNKVAGGRCRDEEEGIFVLGRELDQYETEQYIGYEVVVLDSPDFYIAQAYGTLMRSYEDSYFCATRRTVDIKLHEGCCSFQETSKEGYAQCYVDRNKIYLIDRYL